MKLIKLILVSGLLAGCSSPPPPTPVDWGKKPTAMNGTLPEWKENFVVNPAPYVEGKWSRVIRNFSEDTPYGIDVYYAVAHSSFVKVSASNTNSFFNAKLWLQVHGAKGVIQFEKNKSCITCNDTDIFLFNGIKPDVVMAKKTKAVGEQGGFKASKKVVKNATVLKKPLINPIKQTEQPSTKKMDSSATGKNPFTGKANKKTNVPIKKPQPVSLPIWHGEVGSTLKDTVFRWSASQTCVGGGNWRVIWDTPVNYRIDAPLRFEGDFKAALNGIFGLYQYAQKPLYALTNSMQCLIKVTDKG
ncbi:MULTISPECIES: TcpQ domain-containing protein [Serratia]|uniref:TcpQ domain-containing protein n=1 Tax=Serratia TaxID=613 RepID=UPI00093DBBF1|nr:TcpQ domain-containing protein [Serratia fonticola]OKP21794.1 hypothetical protein BSQ40_25550 [Serratia fonticola]